NLPMPGAPVFWKTVEQDDRRACAIHHNVKLDAMSRDTPLSKFSLYQYGLLPAEIAVTCGKRLQILYCATTAVRALTACLSGSQVYIGNAVLMPCTRGRGSN